MKKTISNTPQSTTLSNGSDINNVIASLQSSTNSLSANLITVNSILNGDQAEIDALENQLNNYALLGSGTNNFSNQNVFSICPQTSAVASVNNDIPNKLYVDNQVASRVSLTGDQTIGGVKTFTSPPVLSGASISANSINDTSLSSNIARLNGNNTFTITPQSSGTITNATDLTTKTYVDNKFIGAVSLGNTSTDSITINGGINHPSGRFSFGNGVLHNTTSAGTVNVSNLNISSNATIGTSNANTLTVNSRILGSKPLEYSDLSGILTNNTLISKQYVDNKFIGTVSLGNVSSDTINMIGTMTHTNGTFSFANGLLYNQAGHVRVNGQFTCQGSTVLGDDESNDVIYVNSKIITGASNSALLYANDITVSPYNANSSNANCIVSKKMMDNKFISDLTIGTNDTNTLTINSVIIGGANGLRINGESFFNNSPPAIPINPTFDSHATSKKYVDEKFTKNNLTIGESGSNLLTVNSTTTFNSNASFGNDTSQLMVESTTNEYDNNIISKKYVDNKINAVFPSRLVQFNYGLRNINGNLVGYDFANTSDKNFFVQLPTFNTVVNMFIKVEVQVVLGTNNGSAITYSYYLIQETFMVHAMTHHPSISSFNNSLVKNLVQSTFGGVNTQGWATSARTTSSNTLPSLGGSNVSWTPFALAIDGNTSQVKCTLRFPKFNGNVYRRTTGNWIVNLRQSVEILGGSGNAEVNTNSSTLPYFGSVF